MRTFIGVAVVCASAILAGTEAWSQQPDSALAEKYQSLLKEFQRASSGATSSDEERMQLIGRVYKARQVMAAQFIELAEANPDDPVAIDALIQAAWYVNSIPWPVELVGEDHTSAKALSILQSTYIDSEKLGEVCQRVATGIEPQYEQFLRTVLEESPHVEVRGAACFSLAHFLYNRLQRIEMTDEQPNLSDQFADLFGRDYVDGLKREDRKAVRSEIDQLFQQAIEKYADIKLPSGGTVGEKARAELFELRHLNVGDVAPDIVGVDQEGQTFRLTDYRDKVVLLDFWHQQ